MLHADEASHGMDLLVRFPAGHIIAPHWHESNEAHEVQRLSCSSKTRCTFYLPWDGKPDSHPAQ